MFATGHYRSWPDLFAYVGRMPSVQTSDYINDRFGLVGEDHPDGDGERPLRQTIRTLKLLPVSG